MGPVEPITPGGQALAPLPYVSGSVQVGVDIGQKLDATALVVMELQRRGGETHFVARAVQRLALGTTYPAVAARLAEVDRKLRAMGKPARFWVDATGVGQPVVDLLAAAGLCLTPVYLTGSDQATTGERGELRLGKALLVSRLQVLLQCERVHLPATAEAGILAQELLNYEIRVNENAAAQFGAFRVGSHDDLATALGLACWEECGWGESAVIRPVDVIAEADRGGW